MPKSKGFTLIELVVVIVILGILAVTAAPRFLNLQDDARNATLKALNGSINSAIQIVYGKAAVDGVENLAVAEVDGIATSYGYPKPAFDNLSKVVDGLSDGPWEIYVDEESGCGGAAKGCLMLGYPGQDFEGDPSQLCFVAYFETTRDDESVGQDSYLPARSYFVGERCGGVAIADVPYFE